MDFNDFQWITIRCELDVDMMFLYNFFFLESGIPLE